MVVFRHIVCILAALVVSSLQGRWLTLLKDLGGSVSDQRDAMIREYRVPANYSIEVDRRHIMSHVTHVLSKLPADMFKRRWTVKSDPFHKVVTLREFLSILSNDMMDPQIGMFTSMANHAVKTASVKHIDRFAHNPRHDAQFLAKSVHPLYLAQLSCMGRIIGMAILNKQHLDVTFTPHVYKRILNKPPHVSDLKINMPNMYKHLTSNSANKSLTMTYRHYVDGTVVTRDLVHGGSTIPVTFRNKRLYVQLTLDAHIRESLAPQLNALTRGIFEIIPQSAFLHMSVSELKALIHGRPRFIRRKVASERLTVSWFWMCVKHWDRDMKARFLLFVTGTSRIPIGTDLHTWINIFLHPVAWDVQPTADPYQNRLVLPNYTSNALLRSCLESAVMSHGGIATWFVSDTERRQYI